jgi:hypothetical protein
MERMQSPHGNFNVYVNLLRSEGEMVFHISFVDKKNKLHVLLLRQENNAWSLMNPEQQPHWVLELLPQLQELLVKHLAAANLAGVVSKHIGPAT